MKDIYNAVGISKQGFHQWLNRRMFLEEEKQQFLPIIAQIRDDHPRLSCRHIYKKLQPITMGRDRFEEFCYENGYKVPVKRNRRKTTNSNGFIYFPNLLIGLNELTAINQLWVSDITYFDIGRETYYLTFITELYNREIIGYNASKSLRTEATTLVCLKMAIRKSNLSRENNLIFHSDGGGQYYSKLFVAMTKQYDIRNSMGKTAYENPFAERINGTIKNDYLIPYGPNDFLELKKLLTKAVYLYNTDRPHKSLDGYSPTAFSDAVERKLLTKKWVVNKKKKVTKKEKVNIIIN